MLPVRAWVWGVFASLILFPLTLHASDFKAFVGYSSPYSNENLRENFTRKDSKITFASAGEPKLAKQTLMSGTVYYMVFERDNLKPNDPWGTGFETFNSTFRPGVDFNGSASPALDVNAKYLYLYQVINHQHSNPPIESASVKLLVDLPEITSWGYYQGLGFATQEGDNLIPLSASHKLAAKTYRSPAPAVPSDSLRLARVPSIRGEPDPKAVDEKIVRVTWDALDPALPPDYVVLLAQSDFDGRPSFRATWTGTNVIGKDGRSTIFGFTSNQPPKLEPVRLRSSRDYTREYLQDVAKDKGVVIPKTASESEALVLAGMVSQGELALDGAGTLLGVEGQVPTPAPLAPGEVAQGGGGWSPSVTPLPQNQGPVGSPNTPGFSMPQVSNSLGSASPSSGGGGGGLIGSGNSNGSTNGKLNSNSNQSGSNVFNQTLTNQQDQSQSQSQSQSSRQRQRQNGGGGGGGHGGGGGGGGNVVPEPASILTGLLGLPALWVVIRRRTAKDSPVSVG